MSTLLKLGLSGYDGKPRFCAFQWEYVLQNPLFLCGKNFGGTTHLCEKLIPHSIVLGGGGVVLLAHSLQCIVHTHTVYLKLKSFEHPENTPLYNGVIC